MFRDEISRLHSALAAMRGQLDSAKQHVGVQQQRAEDLPTEQLVALSVRDGAGHFGVQLARCVGKVCRPSAVRAVLLELGAMEERRSLNRLPADVLSYVFELSVSRLEEVAPLARVSKLFNACVKRPNVLGRLELHTYYRLKRLFPGPEKAAAASLELVATLQQVRLGCPAIHRINLGAKERAVAYVTDEHVRLVALFPSLRSVSLVSCVSVTEIRPLQSLTSLTKLNLSCCKWISGPGFLCLSLLTSLHELDVSHTAINGEGLAGLSRSLLVLTKLTLSGCKSISAPGFACLSSLTSLQELQISHTFIDDKSLAKLATSLTALTKLHLEFNIYGSISGAGFACISSLTSLQELDVRFTAINDEGLAGLSRLLPALTRLNLVFRH